MLEKLPQALGHALINQRAGMDNVVYNHLHARRATARLAVSSRAFAFNARLPSKYTADGAGISPPRVGCLIGTYERSETEKA
jgi:hypothetical protein